MMILKPMHVSGHVRRWQCGHPRTPANTYKNYTTPVCRACRIEAAKARQRDFRCGHPATEENTVMSGTRRRCKICRQAEAQKRRRTREHNAYPMPPCLLQAHWTTAILPVED